MASCFSSPGVYRLPPIYVLSKISRLAECLHKLSIKHSIQVELINLPDSLDAKSGIDENLAKTLKKVEIALCDPDSLIKSHAYMPELKWAHCTWAGVEVILKSIPLKPSFAVTRHSGEAFTSLIAEYVVCNILNFERLSKFCWENQKYKIWSSPEKFLNIRSLNEITVGILGVGNMSMAIAKFLKSRGTTTLGFARKSRPSGCSNFDNIFTDLDEILSKCDYLCNTLPSTPQTAGILNNSVLKYCHKKPVFINVGRGDVISEKELIQALKNNWLSGAVLDVFESEPLPKTSELWNLPEVILTPHVSALSKPEHIAEEFFQNLFKYINESTLENVVDWEAGY